MKRYALLLLIAGLTSALTARNFIRITSPDTKTQVEISIRTPDQLSYRILFSGKEAITWSRLGLNTDGQPLKSFKTFTVDRLNRHNERIPWSLGENDTIVNHYNERTVTYQQYPSKASIKWRVFNGAVAFRYCMDGKENYKIRGENTEFKFPAKAIIYQYTHESVYTPMPVDSLKRFSELPSTIHCNDFYYSISEAENDWYSKASLTRTGNSHSLKMKFPFDSVQLADKRFETPWRTISISNSAIGLHDNADLDMRLTTTKYETIPSWIKPGKLIRAQLNTKSGIDCINFAVKHNLQYILFDAGWYGKEFNTTSDPTKVIDAIDMPAIIRYGKQKGIGVILYVNRVALKSSLDTILPLYKKWGVAGLKFGFIDGVSQKGIQWLKQALQKVTDYGFILDVHDNYKPTGLSRMFPAFLTQEGIRGNENSPDAFHTTTLPFTRFLAGAADFTFCYPNSKESFSNKLKVTKAHQLALSVIFFSPLQCLYWYGQPLDYDKENELEFFDSLPVVWNESRYLTGEIGKYIAVARRKDNVWYMGSVAGLTARHITIKLDFLKKDTEYIAQIFSDNTSGGIEKTIKTVRKMDEFSMNLKEKSGLAVIFTEKIRTDQ